MVFIQMFSMPQCNPFTFGFQLRAAWLCLGLSSLLFGCSRSDLSPNDSPATTTSPDYARDVEPIFAQHCYKCHGPDEEEGGLRLDEPARRMAGGISGSAVIVPGDRAASLLYQYITGQNEDHIIMPPKDRGEPLSAEQCDVVGRWIDGLAKGARD